MVIPRLGLVGQFRMVVRLVGMERDFREPHVVTLTVTDPNLNALGVLAHPIPRGRLAPATSRAVRSITTSE
jgi:hypothetical protein